VRGAVAALALLQEIRVSEKIQGRQLRRAGRCKK